MENFDHRMMRMLSNVMSETEFDATRDYYRNAAVVQRIREFCGGDDFSCEYLIGSGEYLARQGYLYPLRLTETGFLTDLMDEGLDLFRSVLDKQATLAIWDVEYFNLDTWENLYRHQLDYFELMEPTYVAIEEILKEYGILHLNDSTSSGYHFNSLIPFSSPVHKKLEAIGYLEKSIRDKYNTVVPQDLKRWKPTSEQATLGYSGIGRLLEYLSHRVIERAREASPLPITFSDAAVGRSQRGREGMSLDLTQYGDPLYMRDIRTSFSTHQKHKIYTRRVGKRTARMLPPYATIPRNRLSFRELFYLRKDLHLAAEYASQNCSLIPDASEGWSKVIASYLSSSLYDFHREFDSVEHQPPEKWEKTYWKLDLDSLPPCAAAALRQPHRGLTAPTSIQNLCRVLFSLGWHPKHIAGLIRSYYEQDSGWKTDWQKYDPATRANFWARIYCSLIVTGLDTLEDFSCAHQKEKGICSWPACGFSLTAFRKNILKRT